MQFPKAGSCTFSRLMIVYLHPPGGRAHEAYEPHARKEWHKLNDAQKADSIAAAPTAPGNIWLGHWLNDGLETGAFKFIRQQPAANSRVWSSVGTPQYAAWTSTTARAASPSRRRSSRIDGELHSGWMV